MEGYRKIVVALIVVAIASAAVVYKGDIPANFSSLLQVLFASFVVGNGVEHVSGIFKQDEPAPAEQPLPAQPQTMDPAPQTDLSPVLAAIDDVKQHVSVVQQGVATAQEALSFIIERSGLGRK